MACAQLFIRAPDALFKRVCWAFYGHGKQYVRHHVPWPNLWLDTRRTLWMMRGCGMVAQRRVKIVSPVVDTILLTSAIWPAILIRQYPFVQP